MLWAEAWCDCGYYYDDVVEPYLAMKGFVPTCLMRWCSSFALALHAAEGKV